MATRRITLGDSCGFPPIVATCTDKGWNGFHVPKLSYAELWDYIEECKAADPNGTWDGVFIDVDYLDDADSTRVIVMESDDSDPTYWTVDESDGMAWIDGLVWSDPCNCGCND